jgi:CMP/dCMP kinase
MIITVSGPGGSGKSSISKRLEQVLGYKRYYMGGEKRRIAKQLGISLEALNKRDEKEHFGDKLVDQRILELANTEDNIIIEGRTAFHFAPKSVKLYLDVEKGEAARRLFNQPEKRPEESYSTLEEFTAALERRHQSDIKRYSKYYGFDCYDKSHYDIVIDTTEKSIEEVFFEVMEALSRFGISAP